MTSSILHFNILNDFQKGFVEECLVKKNGGLSVPVGSGKTLSSIVLALNLTNKPILVVMSKTLLGSWEQEIKKFFGDNLKYQVLHKELSKCKNLNDFVINPDTRLVLTTNTVISKVYKDYNIASKFVKTIRVAHNIHGNLEHEEIYYNVLNKPYLKFNTSEAIIYSIIWGALIVDEVQKYTNCATNVCRGIASISADFRWVLSGTLFTEPKIERLLGYHLIINDAFFPRNKSEAKIYIGSEEFRGLATSIVSRKTNPVFKPPKVNKHYITNNLRPQESLIYLSFKDIINEIYQKLKQQQGDDTIDGKKYSSQLLAMITYLRQMIVSPLIPISSLCLDMYDIKNKSELSKIIISKINNIKEYLDDANNVVSSRMDQISIILDKHKTEKVIVFTSYRSVLDLLKGTLNNRKSLTITSTMTSKSRMNIINEFNNTNDNTVLFLTFGLGSEGLNLQSCSTVLLTDLWWNSCTTTQAIGRILRMGQEATEINVYYFTSNTGIENAILTKQDDKNIIIGDLMNGKTNHKVTTLKMKEIIKFINIQDNYHLINKITART